VLIDFALPNQVRRVRAGGAPARTAHLRRARRATAASCADLQDENNGFCFVTA
jgi:hypothetical protein